jgi:cytochrome c oxidase subunit 3
MTTSQTIKGTPPPPVDHGDWGGEPGKQRRATITGIYVLFAAITMLFAAFTSALVVRRGLGDDWTGIPIPAILWAGTVVILLSSAALELARRALSRGNRETFMRFWTAGSVLGILFLAGQVTAWRQLRAEGLFVDTNPGSSFFYVFTVAHALHVLGGIVALLYIEFQALWLRLGPGKRTAVEVSRLYWHFLAGLWVYLILLFQLWG